MFLSINSQFLSFFNYSKSGVPHYNNEGVCSWFDLAKMIAEYAGNTNCDILPCHSEEFPDLVRRPSYCVIDESNKRNIQTYASLLDRQSKCYMSIISKRYDSIKKGFL